MSKGQVALDIISFSVILLVMSLSVIIGFYIIKQYKASTVDVLTNPTAAGIVDDAEGYFSTWDKAILFLVGGMGVALIVSVFYIKTHPAFFFISLISLVFALVFIPQISNVFYGVEQQQVMQDVNVTETFPITSQVMHYLPFIAGLMAVVYLVVLFGKPYFKGGGGGAEY